MGRRGPMPKAPDFVHPPQVDHSSPQPTFDGACFVAFVDNASIKYNRSGQLAFTLVVPRDQLNDGVRSVCLLSAFPIPLAVQMEPWEVYTQELAAAEERMRAYRETYSYEEPASGVAEQDAQVTSRGSPEI
jgi:hypothetical protein